MKTGHNLKTGRTACICCNGELPESEKARDLAAAADLLIAADGGAKFLAAMGLKPKVIIGDMDSLGEDPWVNDRSIQRITFPRDKDRSDTELAIEWAIEQDVTHVLLLAAWGGRLDHSLGNGVLLLRFPGRVALWDGGILALAVTAGQSVNFRVSLPSVVSLIPYVEGTRVKTEGLKFTRNDEILEYATHGLSNVAVDEQCSVSVSQGLIILCVEGEDVWLEK